jgi:hypothetical protein
LLDSLCCQYGKPSLDSGTEGTNHDTPPSSDPNQDIASCTIQSYPTTYSHTCFWGREIFQTLFRDVFEFITNSVKPRFLEEFAAQSPFSTVQTLKTAMTQLTLKSTTIADCAIWTRSTFEYLFIRKIIQVISNNETNKEA